MSRRNGRGCSGGRRGVGGGASYGGCAPQWTTTHCLHAHEQDTVDPAASVQGGYAKKKHMKLCTYMYDMHSVVLWQASTQLGGSFCLCTCSRSYAPEALSSALSLCKNALGLVHDMSDASCK